jgi:hypothetical protein
VLERCHDNHPQRGNNKHNNQRTTTASQAEQRKLDQTNWSLSHLTGISDSARCRITRWSTTRQ